MVAAGVMNPTGQSDQPRNMTAAMEALSSWLNHPRRTVIQIEVFTAAAVVLLFFQIIFGSFRRRTNNFFIQGGLWLAYTLLPPLVTYTLGLMQSSPVKNGLYPVWATSLFLLAGGANSIIAYDLDDNKKWKRHLFDIVQWYIYLSIIFRLLSTSNTLTYYFDPTVLPPQPVANLLSFIVILVFLANTFGIFAGFMVDNSFPSKVVSDYMKDHANSRVEFDPVNMKGCKYLVWWRGSKETQSGTGLVYRVEPEKHVITIDMIWAKCSEDMFISHGVSSWIKGACLSYSLSHLLRRRFFGIDFAEIKLPETREFVLEGLLSKNNRDEYMQAFRVIEAEMGFLYDSFFTKYALIFENETLFFLLVILKIVSTFALGVLLLFKSPTVLLPNPIIEEGTRTTDTYITVVVLGTFLIMETVQSIQYLGSDWAMVSLACNHITGNSPKLIPFCLRNATFGFLRRCPLFSYYWRNKMGQYSLIEASQLYLIKRSTPVLKYKLITLYIRFMDEMYSSIHDVHFVKLPDILKLEIISALKSNRDGHLTNGQASLQRNEVFEQFSWTVQNETQTVNMLIWHIATECCRITLHDEPEAFAVSSEEGENPKEEGENQISSYQYREVATKISCYCTYLMFNAPELLPGNFEDTRSVLHRVTHEARDRLGCRKRDKDLLQEVIAHPRDEISNTIITKGLDLGGMLASMQDGYKRWKLMAEFWTETILYIAPSDNVKAHMERLAKGGEFLTHIWALLTHAGILTRPPPEEPTASDDPEEGTA